MKCPYCGKEDARVIAVVEARIQVDVLLDDSGTGLDYAVDDVNELVDGVYDYVVAPKTEREFYCVECGRLLTEEEAFNMVKEGIK